MLEQALPGHEIGCVVSCHFGAKLAVGRETLRKWRRGFEVGVLSLQAVDMAIFGVGGDLTRLIHHADHRSSYHALVYTDRIVGLGG